MTQPPKGDEAAAAGDQAGSEGSRATRDQGTPSVPAPSDAAEGTAAEPAPTVAPTPQTPPAGTAPSVPAEYGDTSDIRGVGDAGDNGDNHDVSGTSDIRDVGEERASGDTPDSTAPSVVPQGWAGPGAEAGTPGTSVIATEAGPSGAPVGGPAAAPLSAPFAPVSAPGYHPGPGHPGYPPYALGQPLPPGYPPPGFAVPAPPKKRRTLLVVSIVLSVTLLLCLVGGVSAFLVLRTLGSGEGAPDPVAAVDGFLEAVYTERNAGRASELVCAEARDTAEIERKVQEVTDQAGTYQNPRFRWTEPTLDERNADRALVSTTLTLITGDERMADQQLRFIVVEKTGWWVCDIR